MRGDVGRTQSADVMPETSVSIGLLPDRLYHMPRSVVLLQRSAPSPPAEWDPQFFDLVGLMPAKHSCPSLFDNIYYGRLQVTK